MVETLVITTYYTLFTGRKSTEEKRSSVGKQPKCFFVAFDKSAPNGKLFFVL